MTHADLGDRTIRPSSLTTADDCARRFAARHLAEMIASAGYELNRSTRRHVGAAVGTAVHAGAAYTLETKRLTGYLGNPTEAEDRAAAALDEELQGETQWDDTTSGVPIAKRQVQRMVRSYRRFLAPELTPLLVETRLTIDVGDGWTVSGQADGVMAGDPHEEIRDLKTGTRARSNVAQYGAYAIVWRSHGYQVRTLVEDYLARVRIDREQPPPVPIAADVAVSSQHAWETIERIKAAAGEFERRVADPTARPPHLAFPANPASQLCSPNFCPAFGTQFCQVHRK